MLFLTLPTINETISTQKLFRIDSLSQVRDAPVGHVGFNFTSAQPCAVESYLEKTDSTHMLSTQMNLSTINHDPEERAKGYRTLNLTLYAINGRHLTFHRHLPVHHSLFRLMQIGEMKVQWLNERQFHVSRKSERDGGLFDYGI